MAAKVTFSFIFLIVLSVNCINADRLGKISGGTDAAPGEFPFALGIFFNDTQYVGSASIISSSWAVSVAHKLDFPYPKNNSLTVVGGSTNLLDAGALVYPVVIAMPHPGYNISDSIINDVGLLKVSPSFDIDGQLLGIATLPSQGDLLPEGAVATTAGWGSVVDGGDLPAENLQKAEVTILQQQVCSEIYSVYNFTIRDMNFCVNSDVSGAICLADGGNLIVSNGVLVGLISSGLPGCAPQAVFSTKLSYFIDWINENITE